MAASLHPLIIHGEIHLTESSPPPNEYSYNMLKLNQCMYSRQPSRRRLNSSCVDLREASTTTVDYSTASNLRPLRYDVNSQYVCHMTLTSQKFIDK
jgi:hypothetical protein